MRDPMNARYGKGVITQVKPTSHASEALSPFLKGMDGRKFAQAAESVQRQTVVEKPLATYI